MIEKNADGLRQMMAGMQKSDRGASPEEKAIGRSKDG